MRHPDLVAYLPCPIKVPFEIAVCEYLREQNFDTISVQIEGNANKNEGDYAQFIEALSPDNLPALLITPGVNQLYQQRFVREVLDSGSFRDVAPYPRDEERLETQLRDPLGHATVLAANVTLMVVDHTHLQGRTVPTAWRDLLAPEFARSVLMRGNGKTFCETTLLAWQQLLGTDSLSTMGRSVKGECTRRKWSKSRDVPTQWAPRFT